MTSENTLRFFSQQLKAVADINRMKVIALLLEGERTASQLNQSIKVSQPTLSHHLKTLHAMGFVRCRWEGVRCFYSLNTENMRIMARNMGLVADYADDPAGYRGPLPEELFLEAAAGMEAAPRRQCLFSKKTAAAAAQKE